MCLGNLLEIWLVGFVDTLTCEWL